MQKLQVLAKQDVKAVVTETSKYGAAADHVHVEMLIQTSQPIPADKFWYVPKGVSVPPYVQQMLEANRVEMYPQAAELLEGTEDIAAQAEQGNLQEVEKDAARLLLRSVLEKRVLTPVPGTTNLYQLSYDYKIFKNAAGKFEFTIQLPFSGLDLVPGGEVNLCVILPREAQVDADSTKGVTPEGGEIQENTVKLTSTGHSIVSFNYKNDPEFFVVYSY